MTDTYKKLYQGQLGTSASAIYTVPGATEAIISSIVIVNCDNVSTHTVDLFTDGSAEANRILPTTTLEAGERITLNERMTLAAASTINGKADAGSEVTVTIFGLEIS